MEIVALLKRDFESTLHKRAGSESAYDARIARHLLDLLHAMRHERTGPRLLVSYYFDRELWLHYHAPNNAHCIITITMDRPDYGPLVDGLPLFHYRMTCYKTDSKRKPIRPAVEDRSRSVEFAVDFVRNSIRETRTLP